MAATVRPDGAQLWALIADLVHVPADQLQSFVLIAAAEIDGAPHFRFLSDHGVNALASGREQAYIAMRLRQVLAELDASGDFREVARSGSFAKNRQQQ